VKSLVALMLVTGTAHAGGVAGTHYDKSPAPPRTITEVAL